MFLNPKTGLTYQLHEFYYLHRKILKAARLRVDRFSRHGAAVSGGGAMTVKEWAECWIEHRDKPNVRPTTLAAHRYVMQNHILPGLGNVELEQLTEADVGQFLDERKHFGSHRPESADYPGLSDETMRHIHRLLQQYLERAVVEKRIDKNPARAFRYTKPKLVKANVLSALEIEDYLDAAERLGYLPMFTLELTGGLLEVELIALKWSDLNAEDGTLTIHGRVVERRELVEYADKTRTISLPRQTVQLLDQEHARHPSSPYMFPHPGTLKPYSPNMVRLLHKRVTEQAGLDHVRFVDLRHTYAVLTLKGGTDARTLASLLGYSRPSNTRQAYKDLPMKEQEKPMCAPCEASVGELQTAAEKITLGLNF